MKSIKLLVLVSALLSATGAFACGGGGLDVFEDKTYLLSMSGITIRTGNLETGRYSYTPIQLGGALTIIGLAEDSLPTTIKATSEKADGGGVLSRTYEIITGDKDYGQKVTTRKFRIGGSYMGNGVWAKGGCGGIKELTQ